MNAVEIEQAVCDLVEAPFDKETFPFAFLEAFGNKATTIKKLRKGTSNHSEFDGGVLQRSNIHLIVCDAGEVTQSLQSLVDSPQTAKQKAKYALATDGQTIEAINLIEGENLVCDFEDLANHFGFFLSLAGITTVKQIRENAFDIKATSRLNRLYVELLRHNPDWDTAERREDLNHFFARLIFCFFAEDTGIFRGDNLFTETVEQMSEPDNAHEVLCEIFSAMNTSAKARKEERLRPYADQFPYVNGGLFSGSPEAPKFSKIARSYLLHVGYLDWKRINPDIFGSMIQAVADDEERGALGMHYTSVPNILKVLNPLFLDELRSKLEEAGDNKRKLLNLRNRMARIRVFDPACGSGNFLVIAYKEMRNIEARVNELRGEADRRSEIPLTNFRGIELRHFSAEIARLALIIAEYQCDVLHRGQKLALLEFLPLDAENWITCGNALRLDWPRICPPTGTGVKVRADDLFSTPLDQTEIDFENEGGETYICGNPPYVGSTWQTEKQKEDIKDVFDGRAKNWKSLDYVAGWFIKSVDYGKVANCKTAFVATNSICQGQQVPILWPLVFSQNNEIHFAHTSFQWANLASHNAGVTVVIVSFSSQQYTAKRLYSIGDDGLSQVAIVSNINAYLVAGQNVIVNPISKPIDDRTQMIWGNKPTDGGNLLLNATEKAELLDESPEAAKFVKRFLGAKELINGIQRYCLWIADDEKKEAEQIPSLALKLKAVAKMRSESKAAETRPAAAFPHRFRQIQAIANNHSIVIPRVSSENREFLPAGFESSQAIIGDRNFALYDSPIWYLAVLVSKLHWIWISTVCVRLRTDPSYSNTLGWNTFPLPTLTKSNKAELESRSTEILIARESHFPATLADLYDANKMPSNLKEAHARNDETLERIYVGRRFKNDTERLEKLFEMYNKLTSKEEKKSVTSSSKSGKKKAVGKAK